MPPKRKANPPGCECFPDHETELECQKEAELKIHLAITAKIILFSETVNIFVGTDKKTFSIHKDLLMLHSGYFANRLSGGEDEKLAIPNIKASLFVDFVSYIYTGKFLDVSNDALGGGARNDELWELGGSLKCPAFQNMCMDDCRNYCKEPSNPWPFPGYIETMYKHSRKGSFLRKFAAHSMVINNPFVTNAEGSKEFKDWERLIQRIPDITMDITMAAGKQWNGTFPWDDEHRAAYVDKEVPLEERWEKHILSTRTKADVKKDAKAKCIRSIIELEHLDRAK